MREVEEDFGRNIDNYMCVANACNNYGNGEFLIIPELLKMRERIAIVACDEYSAWIVPYSEIEERINFIKSGLDNKSITKEMINKINKNLNELHHSLLCTATINSGDKVFYIGMVRYLLEDNQAFFRSEDGRIKMYFGKSAFKKSFDKHSYGR